MSANAPRPPALPVLCDAELSYLAQSALAWNQELLPRGLRASATAGWLTLSGEVLWNYQRQDAAECVRYLPGLAGFSNDITLRPVHGPSAASLRGAP